MNNETLIQDYIANRLSTNQRAEVEHLLETDSEFKAEFESHKDMAVAFKISEAESLKRRFQELENTLPKEKSTFKTVKYAAFAIASVLVIGLCYNIFNTTTGNDLFEDYFEISPNTYQPVTRSNNSDKDNTAFIAYENGNYELAENKFETLLKTSENPNIRYYYASSLLNQSKYDLALEQFQILNKIDFDYTDESLWYTALIYIRTEDYDNAKAQLKRLNSKNSVFKTKERKVLLEKL
eukprot:TRINITY_DN2014_c0_g3_i1.p1 TRINITY_DN2014_c0_g3~~TRINITY_DN2014_c0_g3_i1.p1  ORF type:complete len:238 (+),score=50.77 TRINITY_DN2014_c0_g3_i1:585-1298(+)